MKKKFLVMITAAFMAATLLTACGEEEANAPAPAPASTEAPANNEQSADSDMVSDETFAILQQNYAVMVEYHDAIAETYNSDEIAANPDIEEAMNKAADVIVQMGEIRQDMLTQEDAVTLNDFIIGIVEGLTEIVGEMELTEGAGGAEGTPVSDETFAILQSNWDVLTDLYNQVATAYNNGEYEKNPDFEDLMNQAADILEQIAKVNKDELTEEDAVKVNDIMVQILDALNEAIGVTG